MTAVAGKMKKITTVRARIEPKLKEDSEKVLEKIGLSTSDAIRLFLEQVRLHKGIPFPLVIPNEETMEAYAEINSAKDLPTYDNVDEMFDALGL